MHFHTHAWPRHLWSSHAVLVDAKEQQVHIGKGNRIFALRNRSVNSLQSNTVSGRQQQHLARSHGPDLDRHADDDDLQPGPEPPRRRG